MTRILDQFGKPIERDTLREPQTARVAGLMQSFAGHPSRGLTPMKLANILEAAERGDLQAQCELFDDMEEKDAHIASELQKRRLALLGVSWSIKEPRNASAAEKRAAGYVTELLQDVPNFEDVILDMADAVGKSFSCLEIGWEMLGKEWFPGALHHRPQTWFTVERDNLATLRLRDNTPEGQPLNPFGWMVHVHRSRSGYLTRAGLGRVLAWPFLFKNYAVRDFAEFLEIYGLPLRLGTYAPGASDKEKATLLQAVVNIGHNAAGIIPEGMGIEIKEAAKGAHDPFMAMIEWAERSMSKAILGGTLTSQADGKSSTNALGNVHNEVRRDLLVADARQIAGTLTRDLVYPLLALNTAGVMDLRRCPRFSFDFVDGEEINDFSEGLERLVRTGLRVPARFAYERLQIPEPAEGEEVLGLASTDDKPAGDKATGDKPAAALRTKVAALSALPASPTGQGKPADADVVDDYLGQLDESGLMDALIEPVRKLVEQAGSLEEIRDGLLPLAGLIGPEQFATQMQLALTAAELAGRFEVEEGR